MSFRTKRAYCFGLVPIALIAVLVCGSACSKDTVVKDPGNSPSPSTPATSSTPPSSPIAPVTSPLPSGSAPVAPSMESGQGAPSLGEPQRTGPRGGGLANAVRKPYQPTPTPGDPLPPRPTPVIVMEDGQIKQHWQAPAEAKGLESPFKDKAEAAKVGQYYYNQRCVDCHGQRGYGNGFMSQNFKPKPTNLASKVVQANTDGELFWKITNGRSPMPANRVRFTDEQRWYIVAFLRTLK